MKHRNGKLCVVFIGDHGLIFLMLLHKRKQKMSIFKEKLSRTQVDSNITNIMVNKQMKKYFKSFINLKMNKIYFCPIKYQIGKVLKSEQTRVKYY